jgi:large subunit ribosomal protein L6
MSKIGKQPVNIPEGVSVSVAGGFFVAKGKHGEEKVKLHPSVDVKVDGGLVSVSPVDAGDRTGLVMWGTVRALIANAVEGVSNEFSKSLELKGVGYKVALKGSTLDMVLGFSHNVEYRLPDGVKAEIISPTEVALRSSNKELLGKTAAEIRAFRPPEPYKGKGVRYKGEYVRHKEGKKK